MTRKTTANPKVKSSNKVTEYMIVSDDECEAVYGSYEEEVERQMELVIGNKALTQSVRVFELITTAHPKLTIDYDD